MNQRSYTATNLPKDPLWYKNAVIYEVHVRSFYDSDADGTGDFRGLTEKLGYLANLGVTALWVLPFYPSPLKDDGYDIADYCDVHPRYGTLADFKRFLRAAHAHGLRVITELVLNHTSDQHPWFQRARRAKPGSSHRNFYVWSDTGDGYRSARIIFRDVETSNWTWDKVAGAYYWHRFFSHQPDLNFNHLEVRDAIIRVVDFWLGLGVDGLRLDAVPYLFEKEGTSCENLPETHEFLKMLRRHVDETYGDRVLLAEANQWPEDAVTYLGAGRGDECHMAFHFPLMPRLFMALRMEDRVPIVDILQQTPPIPETAQWALFLRNHDELTLEMVTEEERDYMYRMYAHVHQARLNLGIRRRLAPLLGNDRKRIELLCALLFSLPGTPVIYYGDEIGMGENIFLGDRNGVRTPMQWSADKNAGFSRANPQSLFLPINLDPENHYEAVNVEVQERSPHSLLWWMRRLIGLYKRWNALGQGTIEFLQPENRKVFACIRRHQDQTILVTANFSRFAQPVQLALDKYASCVPVELFGHTEFPAITGQPYFLTLGPHSFYWFSLETKSPARATLVGSPPPAAPAAMDWPVLAVAAEWEEVFHERHRPALERTLQGWLPSQRWFAGQTRTLKTLHLRELISVPMETGEAYIALCEIEYVGTEAENYVLPLACASGEEAARIGRDSPALVVARLSVGQPPGEVLLHDAFASPEFCQSLLKVLAGRRTLAGRHGVLEASHTAVLRRLRMRGALNLAASPGKADECKSSITYGDQLFLKWFRRLEPGLNPGLELARFLFARGFPNTPPLAGALEYRGPRDELNTFAILSAFVPGCKNAWDYTLDTLGRFFERVQTLPAEQLRAPLAPPASLASLKPADLAAQAREMMGTYLGSADSLGRITGAMHLALASETADPNFTPESSTPTSRRGLFQSMRNLTRQSFRLLGQRWNTLPGDGQDLARRVLELEEPLIKKFRALIERSPDAIYIRQHGNYHLGQLLYTGKTFMIVGFGGEPGVAMGEWRLKRSPLRDVASMVRSFHYAAHAGFQHQLEHGAIPPSQLPKVAVWAHSWSRWVAATFCAAYRQATGSGGLLPALDSEWETSLEVYLLRRAVWELYGELNHRPDWAVVPLGALAELLSPGGSG